jgi:acetylornithine deacetylase/succinyl-diaminopimelate desuccinylase-like protein
VIPVSQLDAWIAAHQRPIVGEFVQFLSIPNVSAGASDIRKNADFLKATLARRGLRVEVIPTNGNPYVFAERRVDGASATILIFTHYDGQAVDFQTWTQADPFTPVLRSQRIDRGGTEIGNPRNHERYHDEWRIYARSAATSKGTLIALMAALDALSDQGLDPTVNLRLVIDGEDEIGSPNLEPFLSSNRDKLQADLMLAFVGPMHHTNQPTVVFGARGLQTAQLTVYGSKYGAHSGHYGNWVPNPALRLAHILASLKDDQGHVLIPGFYDDVEPLSEEERQLIEAFPHDDDYMLGALGLAEPEQKSLSLQMALQRPSLNVRGLQSAAVGATARTIIPDRAVAEIEMRLIKGTSGAAMLERLRQHLRGLGYHLVDADPDDATRAKHSHIARLTSSRNVHSSGFRTPVTDPLATRLSDAIERGTGRAPIRIRTLGGTLPVSRYISALDLPALVVPIVNFDNNQHAADENLRLGNLFQGIKIYASIFRM